MTDRQRLWRALGIGVGLTLTLFAAAYFAAANDLINLSFMLYWQAWGMQELLPCTRDGLSVDAGCEVTPWHVIAFYAGLPVGVIVYSLLAHAGLRIFRQRNA